MYLTIHTPTSLIIGVLISNPLLAFVLAFIVHLGWDIIPHDAKFIDENESWQKKIKFFIIFAVIDFLMLAVLLLFLNKYEKINFTWAMIAALVGGILPDIMWGANMLIKGKIKILDIYSMFHNKVIHRLIKKDVYIPLTGMIIVQSLIFIVTLLIYLELF